MRQQVFASGLFLLVAAIPAQAGSPVMNWSGFYVGAHAGYGWGFTDHGGGVSFETGGALAGGQVGINRQIGNLVFGLEGDLSWSHLRGDLKLPNYVGQADLSFSTRTDWLATATGRIGIAQGTSLIYLKGGVAWADMQHGMHVTYAAPAPSDSIDRTGSAIHRGWTLGGGIEHGFAPNWSARLEYAHVLMPRRVTEIAGPTSTGGIVSTTAIDIDVLQSVHLVKLGLNYHFGGPATVPVVAPMAPSGFDWSGYYVGLHAGYGAGRATWLDFDPNQHVDIGGGLAGAQVGLNHQVGRIVFGAEFEGAWTGIEDATRGTTMDGGLGLTSVSFASRIEWLGIAAGRIGFAHDRWLLFAKAGGAMAFQRHDHEQIAPGLLTVKGRGHHHHAGIVLGAGAEFAISHNWSVKAEYNFIDFGSDSISVSGIASGFVNGTFLAEERIRQQLHLAKLGVSYRFAPAAP